MKTRTSLRQCGGTLLCMLLANLAWVGQGTSSAQTSQGPGASPAQPEGPALQWLSVVLISADMEPGATDGDADIPPAVQQVLADVQDFLPFRNYRLHDAGLVGSSGGTIRLRGGTAASVFQVSLGRPTRVALDSSQRPAVGLWLQFELSEIAGSTSTDVLQTDVTLAVGETVVVGTSRVRGQGLIAFITAVASPSSSR